MKVQFGLNVTDEELRRSKELLAANIDTHFAEQAQATLVSAMQDAEDALLEPTLSGAHLRLGRSFLLISSENERRVTQLLDARTQHLETELAAVRATLSAAQAKIAPT